jgi:hypothetical protein
MGVSNQPPDVEHLEPMLERTIANTGACPKTFIADAGYWSEDNVSTCEKRGTGSGRKTIQEIAADHAIGIAPCSAPSGPTRSS